jgi:glycosyltransferase involved in cell wall biosynthesis
VGRCEPSPTRLAEAIVTLLRDDDRRRRMGEEGRRRLEARAGGEAVADATLQTYRRALRQRAPAAR